MAILFLNGCAIIHEIELIPVASPDQKRDPYGAVVSKKMHMVSILLYKEIRFMRDNAIFNIIIENGGKEPIKIGNENISMIFEGHDKKRTVKKLGVLSAKKFMNDVEYEYRKRAINAMVQISRSKDDIYATSLDGGNAKVKFTVLSPGVVGVGRRIDVKTLRETLPDLILNQKTIMPRESITALISCRTTEIPRGITGDIKIKVSIDGEEHGFTFARK